MSPSRMPKSEEARIEQGRLASRKIEEWNRMSATICHEINNPLAAIQNLLFLMRLNPETPPSVTAIAQQATEEVRRIEALARSTLGFFRTARDPEPADLVAAAEAVRLLLGPMLRQRGVEFEIRHSGDCTVNAYADQTREVMLNLVRNACEATHERGGKVTINLEGRADDVLFTVSDQGSGIDPELLPGIFDFAATNGGEDGKGMGLCLVKQLVVQHGGSVEAQSDAGRGTRFTVVWPRRSPKANEAAEQLAAGAGN